ncbi:MAG TPA: hemolysin family protein [Polyangiaceae bacterium]
MLTFVLGIAVSHVFAFLCSISEATLLSVKMSQVHTLKQTRAGRLIKGFKKQLDLPIAAILTINTLAHTVGASIAGASFSSLFDPHQLWIFSLVFSVSILTLTEIVPKTLGVAYAPQLLVPVAYYVRGLIFVLRPFLYLTEWLAAVLRKKQDAPVTSLDEIRLLTGLGRTEGALASRTADAIEGAAALSELTAYDVMVPRNGIVYLSAERSLDENLSIVRRSGHSRLPFVEGNDLDAIEGIVLVKDFLFQLRLHPEQQDFRVLLSPALVIPVTMTLDRLLRTFQEERRHMAVVVDEYGGTQGLVTLEDVLEEIVGEIEDESDRLDSHIIRRPDGSLVCRGLAETRKVFELLELSDESIDEAETVTIGGFVATELGRIPRTGDVVKWQDCRFEVQRATARRAERIRVVRRTSALVQKVEH